MATPDALGYWDVLCAFLWSIILWLLSDLSLSTSLSLFILSSSISQENSAIPTLLSMGHCFFMLLEIVLVTEDRHQLLVVLPKYIAGECSPTSKLSLVQ